ncbi:MAG: hypothetical protein QNJ54_19950 [Prochloraceae cyanobacterium]|nr:hypothetical protein [Prochloraceae cyanobacterium]
MPEGWFEIDFNFIQPVTLPLLDFSRFRFPAIGIIPENLVNSSVEQEFLAD